MVSPRWLFSSLALAFSLVAGLSAAAVPVPELVKNINTRWGSYPQLASAAALSPTKTVFVMDDTVHGEELWITDGTEAGTRLLKDIGPGPDHGYINQVVASAGKVFFSASDMLHGSELWMTDGTEAGTQMVTDLKIGSGTGSSPAGLQAVKGGVVFVADSDVMGTGMWFSDGTPAGTVPLKEMLPGNPYGSGGYLGVFWKAGDTLAYFTCPSSTEGSEELWKTDGTKAGTARVRTLSTADGSGIAMLGTVGNTLYFSCYDESKGRELWKSNGTSAGTVMVKDIATGVESANPYDFVKIDNKGYFLAYRPESGTAIWVTDGTSGGTTLLKSPPPVPLGSFSEIQKLGTAGKKLFANIPGSLSVAGCGIWVYDPKTAAEELVLEIQEEEPTGVNLEATTTSKAFLTPVFGSSSSLFVSDGTKAGTRVLHESLTPGSGRVIGGSMVTVGERLLFISVQPDGSQGELWMSEGSPQTTRRLFGPVGTDGSGEPEGSVVMNGELYFTARDGVNRGIWKSDGTAQGTTQVFTAPPNTIPSFLTVYKSRVYFAMAGGLWRTDGTEAGTELVSNKVASPQSLFVFDGRLVFSGVLPQAGRELCVSDGTDAGTGLLADLHVSPQGIIGTSPGNFLEMDGALYFTADRTAGWQLCRLAAGPSATAEMLTLFEYVQGMAVRPASVEHPQATLFFVSRNKLFSCVNGGQPVAMKTFVSSPNPVTLSKPTLCGNNVIFERQWQGISELWLSNGTEAGTRPFVAVEGLSCKLSGVVGDTIYFSQGNERGVSDLKCIRGDGTGLTHLITDIGAYGASLATTVGNTAFLTAWVQGGIGSLWKSQGTAESTVRIPAISPGDFALLGNRLYFSNQAVSVGRELFSLELAGRLSVGVAGLAGAPAQSLPAAGAVLDLGPQVVGEVRKRTLILRNAGDLPLENITLELASGDEFGLSQLQLASLDGGVDTEVEITFAPEAGGSRSDELSIRVGGDLLQTVSLSGKGLAPGDAPELLHVSSSRLVLAGQPLVLEAGVASADPITSYVWKRDGHPVGDQHVLSLPAVTASAVGVYTFEATTSSHLSVVSGAVSVGVVVSPAAAVPLKAGDTLKLNSQVSAPSGSQIRYEWLQDGQPVPQHQRLRGAFDRELVILRLQASDVGVYTCRVTMTTPSGAESNLETPAKTVSILVAPQLQLEGSDLQHFVGQDVHVQLTPSQPATKFTAKNLPPGLKISSTGLITGRPTKALPLDPETAQRRAYAVTVTAANAAGNGPPLAFSWIIHPMLPPGSYDGLLDRQAGLDGGRDLGSRVKLTVATTGVVSGQLTLGGKTYRFTSPVVLEADVGVGAALAQVSIPRGKGVTPLTLTLQTENQAWYLTLADDQEHVASGYAYIHETDRVLLDTYDGFYTWNGGPVPSSDLQIPQGAGYMTGSLVKSGIMRWAGKLADGTAVTGSGNVVNLDETSKVGLAVHVDLYSLTGALHGWTQFSNQGQAGNPVPISGTLSWNKAPLAQSSKVRVYKNGIPLHNLSLSGGVYRLPAGEGALGQRNPEGEVNASANIVSYILPELYTQQDLILSKTNRATFPKPGTSTFLKTLSFDPKLGTFRGTLVLTHAIPALTRTATFEGVLSYTERSGNGFFLLPQLPEEGLPVSELKYTSQISNHISVTAW